MSFWKEHMFVKMSGWVRGTYKEAEEGELIINFQENYNFNSSCCPIFIESN